jgi:hypothetical protein
MAPLPQYRSSEEHRRPAILRQRDKAHGQGGRYKATQADVLIHSLFLAGVLVTGIGAAVFVLLRASFWEIAALCATALLGLPYCLRKANRKRPGELL